MASALKSENKIMVLDDDTDMGALISAILLDNDFKVKTFTQPRLALEALEEIRPDLIIADINMPEMDGFMFRKHISDDERFRLIPLIFLTARVRTDDRIEALSIGADAFITKPFSPRELIATVQNVLRKIQSYQATPDLDTFTECYSRTFFDSHFDYVLMEALKQNASCSCAMVGLDHFTSTEDSWNIRFEGKILKWVSSTLRSNLRREDILIRYSDSEFFIFFPRHNLEGTFKALERIRQIIASKFYIDSDSNRQLRVTISAGLSEVTSDLSLDSIVTCARQRLHAARTSGGNTTLPNLHPNPQTT